MPSFTQYLTTLLAGVSLTAAQSSTISSTVPMMTGVISPDKALFFDFTNDDNDYIVQGEAACKSDPQYIPQTTNLLPIDDAATVSANGVYLSITNPSCTLTVFCEVDPVAGSSSMQTLDITTELLDGEARVCEGEGEYVSKYFGLCDC